MFDLDKDELDALLLQIEEKNVFNRYKFYKTEDELNLLGRGAFSYVYEMYDSQQPEMRYAAKIIGEASKFSDGKTVFSTIQTQYSLSEQSDNIMRVISLWSLKLLLDEEGKLLKVAGTEDDIASENMMVLHVILTEKLTNIFCENKYRDVALLNDELKNEKEVIRFAKQIGGAILTVHDNGYIHRDIKLENIFWDDRNKVYKLGDFGVAKYVGNGSSETVIFTDGYGAPEIESNLKASYNVTADIYSFGITLFLLLNELKFPMSDGYYANVEQYSKDFVLPAPINASDKMTQIIRKMCCYNNQDRYQSMEEVLKEIYQLGPDEKSCDDDEAATETYTEDSDETETFASTSVTQKKNHKIQIIEKNLNWWEKDYSELNREERKKWDRANDIKYTRSVAVITLLYAILSCLILLSTTAHIEYIYNWRYWVLSLMLFIQAILIKIKELKTEFELLSIIFVIYLMYSSGITMLLVLSLIILMLGLPSLLIGFSLGIWLWMAVIINNGTGIMLILGRVKAGWIMILLLYLIFKMDLKLKMNFNKITQRKCIRRGIF